MRKNEIEDELRSHIELRADDLERSGVPREEAERRARVEFGGYQRVREECREASGGTFFESVGQDVRYAMRLLRRSPGFTLVAVLTLALAIGANAVVFSVMNGLILRPLNVANADRLYEVKRTDTKYPFQSYPDYLDLRDRNRSFDGLAAFNMAQAWVDAGDAPNRAWAYEVSGNYFDLLGIKPQLGRLIHAADEHGPNSVPFVVISHAYWQTHLNGDTGAIGRSVLLNKHPYTIVGVAPPDFHGTVVFFNPDFFVPMVDHDAISGQNNMNDRGKRWVFMTIGRLRDGVTQAQAIADLNVIGADIERAYPKQSGPTSFSLAKPSLIGDVLGPGVRAFVTVLMVLAGLILLAACTNLGSLFAARAADRSREVALRLALGAGRLRILRQLLTEAVLISVTGGMLGLAGSVMVLRGLADWQPFPRFPLTVPVLPDASVYVIALLLALVSGLLFGAVPMRQVLHASPYEIVKAGSVNKVRRLLNARDGLLVVQIAICAVLVTASMVALRGLVRSIHGHFGFQPAGAMLANPELDMAGYRGDAVRAMQTRMVDAVAAIPGVTAVGLIDWIPLGTGAGASLPVFSDDTTDFTPGRAAAKSMTFRITPDYFRAAGTVLLSGRDFTRRDDESSTRVAVVNEELARRVFGSPAGAIGRHYKLGDGTRLQVVGVVEDGKYGTVTEDQQAAAFVPLLQAPSSDTWMIARTTGDEGQLATAIGTRMRELDRGLPIYMQTWEEGMNLPLFPARVATASLGVLGLMGAILSITGIFGMAAYSVSRRLRELGIRVALGARRKEILNAALGRAFKLLAIGSVTGLALGILASRVLSFVVYQATPRDPVVLAGVVIAMSLLGLLATWIPARRALSIDPLILLRED